MPSDDSYSSVYPFALPANFMLEEYRIVRVLGQGGFGITYLAHDTRLANDVAIKELLPRGYAIRIDGLRVEAKRQSDDQIFVWAKQRFIQEARTLARLNHPNIVRVYRFLEANGTAYMVMEFVRGRQFLSWMRDHRHPTEQDLKYILLRLLDGLDHVHQQRLLHRDISPENIFLTESGRPVLLDFGNARATVDSDHKFTDVVRPGYSPIEQYQTVTLQGPFTDLYALAGVIIHAVTGSQPPVSMDRLGQEDPFKPVAQRYRGKYSNTFLASLDTAFSVQPQDRFQRVADWRQMLTGKTRPSGTTGRSKVHPPAKTGDPPLKRKSTPQRPRKRTTHLFLFVLLVAACIAGAVGAYHWLAEELEGIKPNQSTTSPAPPPALIDREHPYVNSLGMEFVPVPGTSVLFCVHQTRKREYRDFVKAQGRNWANMEWEKPRWRDVGVSSSDDEPVVMVSWYDGVAFCNWLSQSESRKGTVLNYRLPSKDEWSFAVTASPFPWGDSWPVPAGSGNYADLRAQKVFGAEIIRDPLPYDDGFATTAPVKRFKPNRFGLYDLGSNVQEWCGPKGIDGKVTRRGASWRDSSKEALASARTDADLPDQRSVFIGFRCVLEISGRLATPSPASTTQP